MTMIDMEGKLFDSNQIYTLAFNGELNHYDDISELKFLNFGYINHYKYHSGIHIMYYYFVIRPGNRHIALRYQVREMCV